MILWLDLVKHDLFPPQKIQYFVELCILAKTNNHKIMQNTQYFYSEKLTRQSYILNFLAFWFSIMQGFDV